MEKLRRTVIKGIPCRFIPLPECPYIQEQRNLGMRKESVYKKVDEQLMKNSSEELNLRGSIWKIFCRVDEIKMNELASYKEKREQTRDAKGNYTLPLIKTPKELYYHYRGQFTKEIDEMLVKDVARSDPKNHDFAMETQHGHNPLYNVLNAYAHYDPEVGYCQGMNVLFAWLLKFLKDRKENCNDADERT